MRPHPCFSPGLLRPCQPWPWTGSAWPSRSWLSGAPLQKITRAVLCFCFSKLSDKPTFVHTLLVIRTNRFIPNVDADGKNLLTKQVLNIRIYPRLYDLVMFCEFMVVFELTISLRMSPLVILVTTLELGSRRKKKSSDLLIFSFFHFCL